MLNRRITMLSLTRLSRLDPFHGSSLAVRVLAGTHYAAQVRGPKVT